MNGFFQLLIAWGVLLVFVLMLYMIDKLNFVFGGMNQAELPETYTDGLFGELYGKPLWDAMSGLPIPGIDKKLVENLKPHYEPVLRQHIEQVFLEGYHHAREGTLGVPSNNRMIPTPRGALESWLPLHHLTSIYEAGSEFFSKPDADVMRVQQNLDQITSMLYARVGISLLDPYSRTLMVHPVGVERPHADSLVPSVDLSNGTTGAVGSPAPSPAPAAETNLAGASNAFNASNASVVSGSTSVASAAEPQPLVAPSQAEGNQAVMFGGGPQTPANDVAAAANAVEPQKADNLATPVGTGAQDDGLLLQPNLGNLNVEQAAPVKA